MSVHNNAIIGTIAKIALDKALYSYDFLYDYIVPEGEIVQVGQRVIVPFGKGNRKQIGIVFEILQTEVKPNTKAVYKAVDDGIILSDEMLELVKWIKENTFCTYFDGVRTVLPTGLGLNITEQFVLKKAQIGTTLTNEEENLLAMLKKAKSSRELDICLDYDGNKEKERVVKSLIEKKIVVQVESAKRKIGDETEKMVRLSEKYQSGDLSENLILKPLTPKQKQVVAMLEEVSTASVKEVCYNCCVTTAVVTNMVKKELVEIFEYEVSRALTAGAVVTESLDKLVFSPKQQEVFDGLLTLMNENAPKCALLRGITGSGKTSIFVKLIEQALNQGKTAIMLVPEIALTPQMVGKFTGLFGSKVAVMHSNLSLGQRLDEYKRVKNGDAKIVIGTRSAIFAPLDNIGIIVIDEEGEHTYKSEKSPRYHARNIAKQRCFRHNAMLLLASATPSMDSYYNAELGKYKLFELTERFSNAQLPEVYMIDMKIEAENGNRGNFSEILLHELQRNLENGEQSMLLLNRRGYHTYASCIACGAVVECPNCNIPLTYHKANNSLICHYCGFSQQNNDKCPKCGSKYIHQSGTGTQRIEDEIQQYFPKARILRMDADTTMTKNAYETKFAQFGNGDYDIMVGTQMIAKGLDFENVTLVGVLLIDKSLYAGDYLGYEKTFSLITQVVGRAGRGAKKGRALLQTFTPDHYVLNLAAEQNYVEFYNQEMEIRKALLYPPVCDICVIGFSSLQEYSCKAGSEAFLRLLTERLSTEKKPLPVRVLGPAKSGMGRLNGRFRYRIIIKCKNNASFRKVVKDVLLLASKEKALANVSFYADMNGEIN